MISFLISIVALVLGYLIYGRIVERNFGPDDRETPAIALADGVDNVVMPTWKIFMIQFLNIAGTGPIFGAIMGMWFGPAAYLWIVFGCIFAGAVHDYMVGMLSERNNGSGLPGIVKLYMGKPAYAVLLVFSVILLVIVGVVFVYSPALLLGGMCGGTNAVILAWIVVIFCYFLVATLMPIDKIIGRFYPIFAISLLFMAVALMAVLIFKFPALPEIWDIGNMDSWYTRQTEGGTDLLGVVAYLQKNPLFPCLFITIACGAISGFHATQSPLMARCIAKERLGRPIFYGAMITEGVVALIWAVVSSYFFYYGGWREVASEETVTAFLNQVDGGKTLIQYFTAPQVVNLVCTGWLGIFGGILAILGVVAAPITSGDTAFRSARLILAETLQVDQRKKINRLLIAIPMFALSILLLWWQIQDADGFNKLWQYFGWSNQSLATFALWTATVYLVRKKRNYWMTLVPAVFMTVICTVFAVISPIMMNCDVQTAPAVSAVAAVVGLVWFFVWRSRYLKKEKELEQMKESK